MSDNSKMMLTIQSTYHPTKTCDPPCRGPCQTVKTPEDMTFDPFQLRSIRGPVRCPFRTLVEYSIILAV